MNKRKHKVVMLPTEDITSVMLSVGENEASHFHLYILSDDSIEKGDTLITLKDMSLSKVLATTDSKLRTDNTGVRTPSVPIPQIPQSFIENYAEHQPEEVELEYEYNDQMPLTTPGSSIYRLKLQNNEVVVVEDIVENKRDISLIQSRRVNNAE